MADEPGRLGGPTADQRDPARGPENRRDPGVVEDGHGPASLVEIQQRLDPLAIGRPVVEPGQLAPSLTYGRPSAAGGTLRPTTPARTTSVNRYGRAPKKLLYMLG